MMIAILGWMLTTIGWGLLAFYILKGHESERKSSRLQDDLWNLQEEFSLLEAGYNAAKATIEKEGNENFKLFTEAQQLRQRAIAAESQGKKLANEHFIITNQRMGKDIAELKSVIHIHEDTISKQQKQVESQTKTIDGLKQNLRDAGSNMSAMANAINGKDKRIAELEKDNAQYYKDLECVQARYGELSEKYSNLATIINEDHAAMFGSDKADFSDDEPTKKF